MLIDLLVDPFDTSWPKVRDLAVAAEEQGYGGVWTWDHLSGVVHGQRHVLEAWTLLSALAAVTSRVALGPLVLNPANRDAGVVAQMAATLQEVSGGRVLLGLGAGTGPVGTYAIEQQALGRTPGHDPERRAALVEQIAVIRRAWSGTLDGTGGFLVPDPTPPIVVGGFGRRMAELAGRYADGLNTQAALPRLEEVVGAARASSAHPDRFLVTTFASLDHRWLDPDSAPHRRLAALGNDRLQLIVRPDLDPARLPAPSGNP
jgi:alkanesulfonate monooxygenase SsuD/methylene tetrahydromethanopterin reductase-like flavin-dependent oxidoreductase (luciferase family)